MQRELGCVHFFGESASLRRSWLARKVQLGIVWYVFTVLRAVAFVLHRILRTQPTPAYKRACRRSDPGRAVPGDEPRPEPLGKHIYADRWRRASEQLAREAQHHSTIDALIVGDSISETWLGRDCGEPIPPGSRAGRGVPAILRETFGRRTVVVNALGADCTHHCLWRVTKSGALDHLRPKVVFLLIGANDAIAAMMAHWFWALAPDAPATRAWARETGDLVAAAVRAIQEALRRAFPGARLVQCGVPRLDRRNMAYATRVIARANAALAEGPAEWLDLDAALAGRGVFEPDGIHLTEAAYRRLGAALAARLPADLPAG